MKKNDIGLLKYCFSVAGQSSQTETEKWIRKVEKCLEDAGAEILSANKKNCFFRLISERCRTGKKIYNIR